MSLDLAVPITGIISFWVSYFILSPLQSEQSSIVTSLEDYNELLLKDPYSLQERYKDELQELSELKSIGQIDDQEYDYRMKLLLVDASNKNI